MPCLEVPDDDFASESNATIPTACEKSENLLSSTRRLSRTVTEIYDTKLRPFGISAVQFSLLEIIGRMQPITRADIARKQELDKSTLTRDLQSILADGWAEEVRECANGRSKPIALTRAGKQLLLDAEAAWLGAQKEAMALLRQHGFVATDKSIARANIDDFLDLLKRDDLAPEKHASVVKLLIEEEDKLSQDLEQLEFAEDRTAKSWDRMSHLAKLRDGFPDGSTGRAQAEKLLTTFQATHQLMERFCDLMRQRVNGRSM